MSVTHNEPPGSGTLTNRNGEAVQLHVLTRPEADRAALIGRLSLRAGPESGWPSF